MIQRIQTVYLFIVLVLSFVCLISGIGYWTVGDNIVADFSNFSFSATGDYKSLNHISGPWCQGVLLIMVMFLTLMCIMLFRKRMRQLRLTIFSTILLVGYVASYSVFAYYYNDVICEFVENAQLTPVFHVKFVGLFPVLSIIFNILAIIGIRKDEALIRSLDRIR